MLWHHNAYLTCVIAKLICYMCDSKTGMLYMFKLTHGSIQFSIIIYHAVIENAFYFISSFHNLTWAGRRMVTKGNGRPGMLLYYAFNLRAAMQFTNQQNSAKSPAKTDIDAPRWTRCRVVPGLDPNEPFK